MSSNDIPEAHLVRYTLDHDNPPPLTPEEKAELDALANIRDEDIDYSDLPRMTDEQLARFVRVNPNYRVLKKSTTVRLDGDILDWLKASGKGWQTRLNGILRAAMLGEQPGGATP